PGWQVDTSPCRSLEDLPPNALAYLGELADLLQAPIAIVSLGPDRGQTILVEDPIHGPKRGLLSH
ncbi:MAG: adenylosuccinate synthetase, partial [Cyanobacteria bacterium MAG IRC1_bin_28]|nr:adenylosuccinate synthetase [Cyanobacteria bacterium MAG IRC1_bin_28]